jgi:hypothetical protein
MTRSPEWYEIKGRLFRFFGTHPGWARWQHEDATWVCGRDKEREHALARDSRVAALLRDPRLMPSRSMPEQHAYTDVTALGWNRLLMGVFTYLDGPAHLDDLTDVAAVLLRLRMSGEATPESATEHVSCEQMDGLVDDTLDSETRAGVAAHAEACGFCARQLAAYQAAASQVSVPLAR